MCIRDSSKSVPVIKNYLNSNQKVGITLSIMDYQSVPGGEELKDKANAESVDVCLDQVKNDDFIGIQMYTRFIFGPEGVIELNRNDERKLVMGYEYYPEALENVLRYVAQKVNCPLIVTENGIGTDNDEQRIKFMTTALEGLQKCIDDGLDIKGYYLWSFLDNFEWLFGYKPKFGLVEVDRNSLERKPKNSLKYYEKIIRNSST